jgi:hypothetical protein
VDQIEIDVLQPEPRQAVVEGAQGIVVRLGVVPQLGGDEQLLARDAGCGDGLAHALLVAIDRRGVDAAIARVERRGDGCDDLVGGDLEHAEAELRDLGAGVEREAWDLGHRSEVTRRIEGLHPR